MYDKILQSGFLLHHSFIPRPKTKPSGTINFNHKFQRGKTGARYCESSSLSTFFVKREMCAAIGPSDFFLRFHRREMLNTETRGGMWGIVWIGLKREMCNIFFIQVNKHFIQINEHGTAYDLIYDRHMAGVVITI